jgi:hypothetical protein
MDIRMNPRQSCAALAQGAGNSGSWTKIVRLDPNSKGHRLGSACIGMNINLTHPLGDLAGRTADWSKIPPRIADQGGPGAKEPAALHFTESFLRFSASMKMLSQSRFRGRAQRPFPGAASNFPF